MHEPGTDAARPAHSHSHSHGAYTSKWPRVAAPLILLAAFAILAAAAVSMEDPLPVPAQVAPVAATAPATAPAKAIAATPMHTFDAPVRGMTISCHSWGWEWGTDEMVESMRKLKELGVTWIAIHPYAGIRTDGTVAMRRSSYDDPTWLTRPIEEAHKLGLKILIKPHLAYWGTPFSWRAEIKFDTDEEWTRFFKMYEAWIIRVAEVSTKADAFAVGTELGGTVHHEQEWRKIIGSIRKVTPVPLTYSGNWDRFQQVPFWDAVDLIGVQSYFPLVQHDRLPEPAELAVGWGRLMRRMERISKKYDRKILLTELGYNRSSVAAQRPWEYRQGGPNAELVQRRCLDAALKALDNNEFVVGGFLWKWFPGEHQGSNFVMSTPVMQETIRSNWGTGP